MDSKQLYYNNVKLLTDFINKWIRRSSGRQKAKWKNIFLGANDNSKNNNTYEIRLTPDIEFGDDVVRMYDNENYRESTDNLSGLIDMIASYGGYIWVDTEDSVEADLTIIGSGIIDFDDEDEFITEDKKSDEKSLVMDLARYLKDDLAKYKSVKDKSNDMMKMMKLTDSDRDYEEYESNYSKYQSESNRIMRDITSKLTKFSGITFHRVYMNYLKMTNEELNKEVTNPEILGVTADKSSSIGRVPPVGTKFIANGVEYIITGFGTNDKGKYVEIQDTNTKKLTKYPIPLFQSKRKDGVVRVLESLFHENSKDTILSSVINQFGITDTPYHGPSFILPNGYFLNLSKANHHSDVEKWLIDTGLSSYEYIVTGGSPSLMDLGCIRCDYDKYYMELTDTPQPKRAQYNSLLVWLDFLSLDTRKVQVMCDKGRVSKIYKFDEYIPDEIVEKIKRYYSFGRLDEGLLGIKYDRHKIGESIVSIDRPNKYNSRLMEVTRSELVSKSRSEDPKRYTDRMSYRPASFEGVNIKELFENDDLVFTTKVGNWTCTLAVSGVLSALKELVGPKNKCTYADVLKVVNKQLDKDGLRIECSCPDWLYGGYKYMATKGGYNYGTPEYRPPKRNNPLERGSMCKHLASVITNKTWIVKVAAGINNWIRVNLDQAAPYIFDDPEVALANRRSKKSVTQPIDNTPVPDDTTPVNDTNSEPTGIDTNEVTDEVDVITDDSELDQDAIDKANSFYKSVSAEDDEES